VVQGIIFVQTKKNTVTMYTIVNNEGKLMAKGKYGNEAIHIIHCSETIYDIKEDVAIPFIVAEESGNFARVHLVTDFSANEAMYQVLTYLQENEGVEEPHLIGVFECAV